MMILSRTSRALRDQNWLAVVIEFVIVLAGVVAGFQISAWYERQQDAAREALLLDRLRADFIEIEARTADAIVDIENRIDQGRAFNAMVGTGSDTPSLPAFFEALRPAVGTPVPLGRSATYTELVASGEMRLVRSEALRAALVEFDEQVRRQELAYTTLARMVTENAGLLLYLQSFDTGAEDLALPSPYLDEVREIRISPDLFAAARTMLRINLINRGWHEGSLEAARAVLAELPRETAP